MFRWVFTKYTEVYSQINRLYMEMDQDGPNLERSDSALKVHLLLCRDSCMYRLKITYIYNVVI